MSSLTITRHIMTLGCAILLSSCGNSSSKSNSSSVQPPQTLETNSVITMTDGHGVSYNIISATDLKTGDGRFSGTYTYTPGPSSARFSMTLAEENAPTHTITSSGEMTFTSETEGYYSVTQYNAFVPSPAGMSGPFKISKQK